MLFIELPTFIRSADGLLGDDDLAEVQTTLLENPLAGDLISGGKGLRKLRVALPGRGKRGGARVIYYYYVSEDHCYMIYAYAKNTRENLTQAQLRQLVALIDEEIIR